MEQKGRELRRLPDAELEIMRIVWAAGAPVSSGDVFDRIVPQGKWARTTVLNFLARLETKGFVSTSKQGKCNVYTALVDENSYLSQECGVMFREMYGGSLTEMVSLLYDTGRIDNDDLTDLLAYINQKLEPPTPEEKEKGGRWQSWYQRHFRTHL